MQLETARLNDSQSSAGPGGKEAPETNSSSELKLTPTSHPVSTESLCCSRDVSSSTSPGKYTAAPLPASSGLSPCLAGGSTAATPSPLPDEDFKDETLAGPGTSVAANTFQSQNGHFDKDLKATSDDAPEEACPGTCRKHPTQQNSAGVREERDSNGDVATERDAEKRLQRRVTRTQGVEIVEALGSRGLTPEAKAASEHNYQVLLPEAHKDLPKSKAEDTSSQPLPKMAKCRGESVAADRKESFCNMSPPISVVRPLRSAAEGGQILLLSAASPQLPEHYNVEHSSSTHRRSECDAHSSVSSGTKVFNNRLARSKDAAHLVSSSPRKKRQGHNNNQTKSSRGDPTAVLRGTVSATVSPYSSVTGFKAAVKPCINPSPISLLELPLDLCAGSTSCTEPVPRQAFMTSTEVPPGYRKTGTQQKLGIKSDIAAGSNCPRKTSVHGGLPQTQGRNPTNNSRRNCCVNRIREANNGKARDVAESCTYNIRALLAVRMSKESSTAGYQADDAFDKVQAKLQTRYHLVERLGERDGGTSAMKLSDANSGVKSRSGMLAGVFPWSTSELPTVLHSWEDPNSAARTLGPPPPPPPPPPCCLSQPKEEPGAFCWQQSLPHSGRPFAAEVAARAAMYSLSACGFVSLPPAFDTCYRDMNTTSYTCTGRSSSGGNVFTGAATSKGKARSNSLNPLAPAFEPRGQSLLLRSFSNAAEHQPVQSAWASSLPYQPCAVMPCSKDTTSSVSSPLVMERNSCKAAGTESSTAIRNTFGGYPRGTVDYCTKKCDLRTLSSSKAPAAGGAMPRPDHKQEEGALPHLLTLQPDQQYSPLSLKQNSQVHLQHFQQASSRDLWLNWPVQLNEVVSSHLRQLPLESPQLQHQQSQQQSQHQQLCLRPRGESLRQLPRKVSTLVSNCDVYEPHMAKMAKSYACLPTRGDEGSVKVAHNRGKTFHLHASGYSPAHVESFGGTDLAHEGCLLRRNSLGGQGTSGAFMCSVKPNFGFRGAVPVLSQSSYPVGHLQRQPRAAAFVHAAAGDGLPAAHNPVSLAVAAARQLKVTSHIQLTRGVCSKAVGLEVGLAEVLDPLEANRMLLNLGKMLRLTHLQVLRVVRRASGAGLHLRLTDLPAAFLKEHNAVLDLRSLGLLHIREMIAGMGRSLLVSWQHQYCQHPPVMQQRPHREPTQRHTREPQTLVDGAGNSAGASVGKDKSVAAEQVAPAFSFPPPQECSNSAEVNSPTGAKADITKASIATDSVLKPEGCSDTEVLLKQSNNADVCYSAVRTVDRRSMSDKASFIPEELSQSQVASLNRPHEPHAAATATGRLRERRQQKHPFAQEDEGDLLLLEGEPLPSVMQELLQHLLVSLIADALHHVSPPTASTGEDSLAGPRYHRVEEVVAAACISDGKTVDALREQRQGAHQKQQETEHIRDDKMIAIHESKAQSAREISTTEPCNTSNAAAPADDTPKGDSTCGRVGSEALKSIRSSAGAAGLVQTRGIPLQLLPTLWQLKYGVRCNLTAMLETCGYTSLRGFIVEALPCVHFSASGTHVVIRLAGTTSPSACPTICAAVEDPERKFPATFAGSEKEESGPTPITAKAVPCEKFTKVPSKTTHSAEGGAGTGTRGAAALRRPGTPAAPHCKNDISKSIPLPQPAATAEHLSHAHVQGVPVTPERRSVSNPDGRDAEFADSEKRLGPSGKENCVDQSRTNADGETPVATGMHPGSSVEPHKHTDAKHCASGFMDFFIPNKTESKVNPPVDNSVSYAVTGSSGKLVDICSPAGVSALSSLTVFQDSSISPAVEAEKRQQFPGFYRKEDSTTGAAFKADEYPPLPTLLAGTLVDESPAKTMQQQQQRLQTPHCHSCTNKRDFPAEDSKSVGGYLLDSVVPTPHKSNNQESPQRQQTQQQKVPRMQISQQAERPPAASPRDRSSSPPHEMAAERTSQLDNETQHTHLDKKMHNGERLNGTPCAAKIALHAADSSAAAALRSQLQDTETAVSGETAAFKYCEVVTAEDTKLEGASTKIQMCSAVEVLATCKISQRGKALATRKQTGGEALAAATQRSRVGRHPVAPCPEVARTPTEALAPDAGAGEAAPTVTEAACTTTSGSAARPAGNSVQTDLREPIVSKGSAHARSTPQDAAFDERARRTVSSHPVPCSGAREENKSTTSSGCRVQTEEATDGAGAKASAERSAHVFAPQSRVHLHCMLYEVVATGCEKRGRAWARGEDLIELEEEVRQREAAATQLQRLHQLRKRQQQQLFQQMVKKKERLLGESHRIIKAQQEVQTMKDDEHSQHGRTADSRASLDAPSGKKKGLERTAANGDAAHVSSRATAAARITKNSCTARSPSESATRPWHCNLDLKIRRREEEPATERPNGMGCQGISKSAVNDSSGPAAGEDLTTVCAEDDGKAAGANARSTDGREKKDEATTRMEGPPATEKAALLLGSDRRGPHELHQSSETTIHRVTTRRASTKIATGVTPIRLAPGMKSQSPSSSASAADNVGKPSNPKEENVLREQEGDSSSFSDDSCSSAGAPPSPTGLLLDEGIRLLMDERLVRRKLKKKAKKEKKKRKKVKLRALEMQEREQRRLLGLVDQLMELPKERISFHAFLQTHLAAKGVLACTAAEKANNGMCEKPEPFRSQETEKTCVGYATGVCASPVPTGVNEAANPPIVPSPASADALTTSFPSLHTATIQPEQQHSPSVAAASTSISQPSPQRGESVRGAVDRCCSKKEEWSAAETCTKAVSEETTSASGTAADEKIADPSRASHNPQSTTGSPCKKHKETGESHLRSNPSAAELNVQHLSSTPARAVGGGTGVSLSAQGPSGSQQERQLLECQVDEVLSPPTLRQHLQHEFVTCPLSHQQYTKHQQVKGVSPVQQQATLSLLSGLQLAEELRRYRNRSVGMLVSAIKGEWQRRFSSQAPSLSACMHSFKIKQLKSLLLEVPNLLILGSGGTMRVSTIEHAVQFCRPFPPPVFLNSPSGRRIAYPMTITPSSSLSCFGAHIYTHDCQSNVPFPLADAAYSATALPEPPLAVSLAGCAPEAAYKEGAHMKGDQKTVKQREQRTDLPQHHQMPKAATASQPLQTSPRQLKTRGNDKQETVQYRCTAICAPKDIDELGVTDTAGHLQHPSQMLSEVRSRRGAGSSGELPHTNVRASGMRGENGSTSWKGGGNDISPEEGKQNTGDLGQDEGSAAEDSSLKTQTTASRRQGGDGAALVQADSKCSTFGETEDPERPTLEGAAAQTAVLRPPAETVKTVLLTSLTESGRRTGVKTGTKSKQFSGHVSADQVATRAPKEQKQHPVTSGCEPTALGSQDKDSRGQISMQQGLLRLQRLQREAFNNIKGMYSETQAEVPVSDEVESTEKQKQQLRARLQRSLATLLLSIVGIRCHGGSIPFEDKEDLSAVTGREQTGETLLRQPHLPSASSRTAGVESVAKQPVAVVLEKSSGCTPTECSSTFSGRSGCKEERGDCVAEQQTQQMAQVERTEQVAEQLLYRESDAAAEAEAEEKEWVALQQDLLVLGSGKRQPQTRALLTDAPVAETAAVVVKAQKGPSSGGKAAETGVANPETPSAVAAGEMPKETAIASQAAVVGEKQQQHQVAGHGQMQRQPLKGQRKPQSGSEEQHRQQTLQEQQKEQEPRKRRGIRDKEIATLENCQGAEEKPSSSSEEIQQAQGGSESTLETEGSDKTLLKRVRSLFATRAEARELKKLGYTGVPLRGLLRDWRLLCRRLYQELDCMRRCSEQKCSETRSATSRDCASIECCRKASASTGRFTDSSSSHSATIMLFASSAHTFPSALLAAAGWSSVLRAFLLLIPEDNKEERRRFCITCEDGELACYAGSPRGCTSRQAHLLATAAAATVFQDSKSSAADTHTHKQSNGTPQHARQWVQYQQELAQEGEGRKHHRNQVESPHTSLFDHLSNCCTSESPGTRDGALTQPQKHQASLQRFPPAQGKQSKPMEKSLQQQNHQQRDPHRVVRWKSSDSNSTALSTPTAAPAQAGGNSLRHHPMVKHTHCKSGETKFTNAAAGAAAAPQGRSRQAEVPREEAVGRQHRLQQQLQQRRTLTQRALHPPLAVRAGGRQQEEHQEAMRSPRETYLHCNLARQYVLHQRLQTPLKELGFAPAFVGSGTVFASQGEEKRSLSRQQGSPTNGCSAAAARNLGGQRVASVHRVSSSFVQVEQNTKVLQAAPEETQQQHHDHLVWEAPEAQCVWQPHILHQQQPQPPQHQPRSQLELPLPQHGLFVEEQMKSVVHSPPNQQDPQQSQQQQEPPQQLLQRLLGNRRLLQQSQEQFAHRRLLQQSLQLQERLQSRSEAGKVSDYLRVCVLQRMQSKVENEMRCCSPEKRPPNNSEAAAFAAPPFTAYSSSSIQDAPDLTGERRIPSHEMLRRCRLVKQQLLQSSSGGCTSESKDVLGAPHYSLLAPASLRTFKCLGSPCNRGNSTTAAAGGAADWLGWSAAVPCYEHQHGISPYDGLPATACAPRSQEVEHACRKRVMARVLSLTKRKQQTPPDVHASFSERERNSRRDVSLRAAPKKTEDRNFAPPENLEQLLTCLLLPPPSAAAPDTSVAIRTSTALTRAPSGFHKALREPAAGKTVANISEGVFADPNELPATGSYYIETKGFGVELPSLTTYGIANGCPAPAQPPEGALGLTASADGAARNQCASRCSADGSRCYCNSGSSRSFSSSLRERVVESSVAVSSVQQQRPSMGTETQMQFVPRPSKQQAESPQQQQQLEKLSRRIGEEAQVCNEWGLQQLMTSGTPPGLIVNSSTTGAYYSGEPRSSLASWNAEGKLRDAPESIVLRNARNTLLLLDQLQHQLQLQQLGSSATTHFTPKAELIHQPPPRRSTHKWQPRSQQKTALRRLPSQQLQEGGPATQQQQQQGVRNPHDKQTREHAPKLARQSEEALQQQQKVRRESAEEVQRGQVTEQYQTENQQLHKAQLRRQLQQSQQLQQQRQEELEHRWLQCPPRDHLRLHGARPTPSCQHDTVASQRHPCRRVEGEMQQIKPAPQEGSVVRLGSDRLPQVIEKDASSPARPQTSDLPAGAAAGLQVLASEIAAKHTAAAACRRAELRGTPEQGLPLASTGPAIREARSVSVRVGTAAATAAIYTERPADMGPAPLPMSRMGFAPTVVTATEGSTKVIQVAGAAAEGIAADGSPAEERNRLGDPGSSSAPDVGGNYECGAESHSPGRSHAGDRIDFSGKHSRSPAGVRSTAGRKRTFAAGPLEQSSNRWLPCRQHLQHTRQQQQQYQQHAALHELDTHKGTAKRQRNRAAQHQAVPGPQEQRRQQSSNAQSGATVSAAASSESPESITKPYLLTNSRVPNQQGDKSTLQHPSQPRLQQPACGHPRRELKCKEEPSNNAQRCTDSTGDEKTKRQNGTGSRTPLQQEQRPWEVFDQEDGSKDAPRPKQRDLRDDLSCYARRILAQLNSSSRADRTLTLCRHGTRSTQAYSALNERRTPVVQQHRPEAVKHLRAPATRRRQVEQLQEQQQQGTPTGKKQSPPQRQPYAEAACTGVLSLTACRQGEATPAEGPVFRNQTISCRDAKINSSVPSQGNSASRFPPPGKSTEQRYYVERNHYSKLQAASTGANSGDQQAAASATSASDKGQKSWKRTITPGTHVLPAFWRKK